jgi:hypothetical protein
MATTEQRLDDLEAQMAQALDLARHHGDEHSQEGRDPVLLWQRQITGWAAIAAASSDLTLTTSNQDVAGATLTLPHIGDYEIDAGFDFEFTSVPPSATDVATIGVLTDSGDTEVDSPRAAILTVPSVDDLDSFRAGIGQRWLVTTTVIDTVYKLRARKNSNLVGLVAKVLTDHTTIKAHYIGRNIG